MADAWDDDWIQKAESKSINPDPPAPSAKLSKAERRARQQEFNRQIWQDADNEQQENYFLKTQGVVPLKSDFKPAVKVLSRKPTPQPVSTADGMSQLNLEDDDDEDDTTKNVLTPEERKQKAQREREEKQRAYEERRRELFGSGSPAVAAVGGNKGNSPRNQSKSNLTMDNRPLSSASNKARQLYDPNEFAKPESLRPLKKEPQSQELRPTREPRAPDGSGRGGFGFAPRGGHPT